MMVTPDKTDGSEKIPGHRGEETDPVSGQSDQNDKSGTQALREEIRTLKDKYERDILRLKTDNVNRARDSENLIQRAVAAEEERLKNSWSWRLGRAMVLPVVLVKNLLCNPYLFITERQYRFSNIYFFPDTPGSKTGNEDHSGRDVSHYQDGKTGKFKIDPDKLTLTTIFDTFTHECFAPEFNALSPTPGNWKAMTARYSPRALFVESAWRGNEGTWSNLVAKANDRNLEVMSAMVSWHKDHKIPTIFWNKEDPVSFDLFLETAKQFDHIFTTDADCIPGYREHTGCSNIYALPFAAQPGIHNPVFSQPRNGKVCFAGTFYNDRFAERKADFDLLLKPALPYGLDIYDRKSGSTGITEEQFRFPDIYRSSVRGSLDYTRMVEAYKKYSVFLNINSVKYSPTMFARRVFELLACGTPVISSYSEGIVNILGENTVLMSESESETRDHLEHLLNDRRFWWKQSLNGIRKVLAEHTYTDRARFIFSVAGLDFPKSQPVSFLVIAEIHTMEDAEFLSGIVHEQSYAYLTVLLLSGLNTEFSGEQREGIRKLFHSVKMVISAVTSGQELKSLLSDIVYSHGAFLNSCSYYGKNYLRDFALAARYSGAKILGIKSGFSADQSGLISEYDPGHEYRYVESVPVETMVAEKELLLKMDLSALEINKDFTDSGARVFSIDPYNFLRNGRNSFEKNRDLVKEYIDL